jgi:DNA-binding IclR family transcriptional regulator
MPRKPAQPSEADLDSAPGGSAAVDRALSLLAAFRAGDSALTLTELAGRTGLYKSTVLRLLASLVHARLLQRGADQRYALGPELARLGALCSASFSLEAQLLPVMRELVASTGESASFHVRRGTQRLCLLRVDSPQLLRDHIRVGDVLPLNRGAGGRVLLAFSGQRGGLYAQIRRDGMAVLNDDRVVGLTGISAPVWGAAGELVGALTLTLPGLRMRAEFVAAVRGAAQAACRALGGTAAGIG